MTDRDGAKSSVMASAVGKKFINKSENVVEEMVQVCQRQAAVPQRAAWLRRLCCVCKHAPGLACHPPGDLFG